MNSVIVQLMLKLKKKELLRKKSEERNRARKVAAEQRAELRKKGELVEQTHRQRKEKRFVVLVKSSVVYSNPIKNKWLFSPSGYSKASTKGGP